MLFDTPPPPPFPRAYAEAVAYAERFGARPAGSGAERRAQAWVAARLRAAGLPVHTTAFALPGGGRSRNVIARVGPPRPRCLKLAMAHADSVRTGAGADDNASGIGVLVALAPRLAARPGRCGVWLVATGAEERVVTGSPDHLGALALVRELRRRRLAPRLRWGLALDMLGRGRRFSLRSPRPRPRAGVEGQVLRAAARARIVVRWTRDSGTGNSDHRELELAGLPGMYLQVWRGFDACHHASCDLPRRLQPGALPRVMRVAEAALRAG